MSLLASPYLCARCAIRPARVQKAPPPNVSTKLCRQYSVKTVPKDGRPFRLAVIGSGPAGFYTTYKIMAKIENAVVDMYENLPVPFGLVRFGVAPDHPEVKNCQAKFEEVAESPNFNYCGNIGIGSQPGSLPLTSIAPHYDAILFAYGASKDRRLGIPGEDKLNYVYSARAFVGWYNGLPEYADLNPNLSSGEEAVVIGQGNVALDVARILLSDVDVLRKTDITQSALEALTQNRIKSVKVIGRRGPIQAAFTIKEARELMRLPSVGFRPVDLSLIPENISQLPRAQRRIMELLKKGSETPISSAAKTWSLDFQLSPTGFNDESSLGKLKSLTLERTHLRPHAFDPFARVEGSGDMIEIPAAVVFRSIGYKSEPLEGLSDLGIPFDERLGIIPNDEYGRILNFVGGLGESVIIRHVPGMYCAGWVKRGPTGVIASTMNDAFSTAEVIARDWFSHATFNQKSRLPDGWDGLREEAEKRGCRRVNWQDWRKIDRVERERGKAKGKEREKFNRITDMLDILD